MLSISVTIFRYGLKTLFSLFFLLVGPRRRPNNEEPRRTDSLGSCHCKDKFCCKCTYYEDVQVKRMKKKLRFCVSFNLLTLFCNVCYSWVCTAKTQNQDKREISFCTEWSIFDFEVVRIAFFHCFSNWRSVFFNLVSKVITRLRSLYIWASLLNF